MTDEVETILLPERPAVDWIETIKKRDLELTLPNPKKVGKNRTVVPAFTRA